MMVSAGREYDVIVLGGGLAGQCLARQLKLALPALRLLVVEKRRFPAPEAAFKVGESVGELAGKYLSRTLGLKHHLQTHQLRKMGLRFFCTAGDNGDIARRVEFGPHHFPPVPGYQLDRGRLENHLARCNVDDGVEVLDGTSVREVVLNGDRHGVRLQQGGAEGWVRARWVVDASGRARLLKRHLGLAQPVQHGCDAVWLRVDAVIDVDEWSDSPSWHARVPGGPRRLSTNHLLGPGYWVWLIPLAGGATSVGIVADPVLHPFRQLTRFESALDWLRVHEPQCARAVERERASLMDFKVLRHFAHGCRRVYSADRWAITGEAGVFTDPLYSTGSDLIAISNTFISDLIARELGGEDISARVAHHSDLYFSYFRYLLEFYTGQYPGLGNAQAVMIKAVWDQTVYFAVPSLLAQRDKLTDVDFMASIRRLWDRHLQLNDLVQALAREWPAWDRDQFENAFVSQRDFTFLWELHKGLAYSYDDETLRKQIGTNLRILEHVAGQILDTARRRAGDFTVRQFLELPAEYYPRPGSTSGLERYGLETMRYAWLDSASVAAGAPCTVP